jgi:hypothetical protein
VCVVVGGECVCVRLREWLGVWLWGWLWGWLCEHGCVHGCVCVRGGRGRECVCLAVRLAVPVLCMGIEGACSGYARVCKCSCVCESVGSVYLQAACTCVRCQQTCLQRLTAACMRARAGAKIFHVRYIQKHSPPWSL